MYKKSFQRLQWLGKTIDYFSHNNNPTYNNIEIIRKIKVGVRLKAVVEKIDISNTVCIRLDRSEIKGEAILPKYNAPRSGDLIIVEIEEIGYKNNAVYVKVKYVRKLQELLKNFVCNKCNKGFNSLDQLNTHIEYACSICKCDYCGEKHDIRERDIHKNGKCKQVESLIADRTRPQIMCPYCNSLISCKNYNKHVKNKCPNAPRS